MKVLAFGAHADDVEIGMGGTVARFLEEGHDVKIVSAIVPHENIDGVPDGKDKKIRMKSALNAAEILGAEIEVLDMDPYEFTVNRHYTKIFDKIIRNYTPDEVFVNWNHDSHQDHRAMADMIFAAARKNNFSLFMYESMIPGGIVPSYFRPQLFVNVSGTIDKKIESLKAYWSIQLFDQVGEGIVGRSSYRGNQIGVDHAEAFEIVKKIRL